MSSFKILFVAAAVAGLLAVQPTPVHAATRGTAVVSTQHHGKSASKKHKHKHKHGHHRKHHKAA